MEHQVRHRRQHGLQPIPCLTQFQLGLLAHGDVANEGNQIALSGIRQGTHLDIDDPAGFGAMPGLYHAPAHLQYLGDTLAELFRVINDIDVRDPELQQLFPTVPALGFRGGIDVQDAPAVHIEQPEGILGGAQHPLIAVGGFGQPLVGLPQLGEILHRPYQSQSLAGRVALDDAPGIDDRIVA